MTTAYKAFEMQWMHSLCFPFQIYRATATNQARRYRSNSKVTCKAINGMWQLMQCNFERILFNSKTSRITTSTCQSFPLFFFVSPQGTCAPIQLQISMQSSSPCSLQLFDPFLSPLLSVWPRSRVLIARCSCTVM